MRGDTTMLRIGTVFSGIGAFEHALERLHIPHTISFACDNGGIDIWKGKSEKEIADAKLFIHSIKDPKEKKDYIDNLYLNTRKTNFVERSYMSNYTLEKEHFHQDATFLDGNIYKDNIDIFVGGSPCQSFSIAGKKGGLEDTRGTLFYDFARLVKEIQPTVFIYENVKGVLSHDKGKTWAIMSNTFHELGYDWHYSVLTPTNYGIPQRRYRLFVVGFKRQTSFAFPLPKPLTTTMKDYLMDHTPEKYFLNEKGSTFVVNEEKIKKKHTQINGEISLCQKANQQFNLHGDFIYEPSPTPLNLIPDKYFLSSKLIKYVLSTDTKGYKVTPTIDTDIAKSLLATMHKMHRAQIDNYVTTNGRLRKLMPRECLRLMGFCDSFKQVVSDHQMYRQAGNSIVVDVLMAIVNEILQTNLFPSLSPSRNHLPLPTNTQKQAK